MAAVTTSLLVGASVLSSAVGFGTQMLGASKAADAQKKITQGEMEAERVRQEAMRFKARRELLEISRRQQVAASLGLTRATAQGAQEGSGYLGGQAQIAAQGGFQSAGIFGALQSGEELFEVNKQIGSAKMDLAGAQSLMQTGQGLSSFGGSLMNAAPAFSRLSQGFKNPWGGFGSFSTPGTSGLY